MARTVRTCRQIVRTRRRGIATQVLHRKAGRNRDNTGRGGELLCKCYIRTRHGRQSVGKGQAESGRGERRREPSEPVGRLSEPNHGEPEPVATVAADCRHGCHGVTVATAHRNATGTARRIGTGANPSERRERHGGRLWRVWREPVGRLSAAWRAIVRTCRRDCRRGCHGERLPNLSPSAGYAHVCVCTAGRRAIVRTRRRLPRRLDRRQTVGGMVANLSARDLRHGAQERHRNGAAVNCYASATQKNAAQPQ